MVGGGEKEGRCDVESKHRAEEQENGHEDLVGEGARQGGELRVVYSSHHILSNATPGVVGIAGCEKQL